MSVYVTLFTSTVLLNVHIYITHIRRTFFSITCTSSILCAVLTCTIFQQFLLGCANTRTTFYSTDSPFVLPTFVAASIMYNNGSFIAFPCHTFKFLLRSLCVTCTLLTNSIFFDNLPVSAFISDTILSVS